jgi:TRAP-type mannitol/chloroaromatic compound transport system substrate-binding protein
LKTYAINASSLSQPLVTFWRSLALFLCPLPWEDLKVALQTGEVDGLAWSRITEDYTSGWSKFVPYFLTNNISGAWVGHFFANMERWDEVPAHLKKHLQTYFDQSHYHRQRWYCWWKGQIWS